MAYNVYAKLWGFSEPEFVDSFDTLKEAAACARHNREHYPDDFEGLPVRYFVSKEAPPEPGIPYEQLAAAGLV
jgi:hypothetical protein